MSPWSEVTVAAGSCLEADVAAKAAFLLGDSGPDWLDERELPGRFRAGVREVANESWRRALEPAPFSIDAGEPPGSPESPSPAHGPQDGP